MFTKSELARLTFLFCFHSEIPDGNDQFPIWKGGIFRPGKEIKGLRGGVHRYAAQASPKIDAAWAEKTHFRAETILRDRVWQ
jgi:hypothetical protein